MDRDGPISDVASGAEPLGHAPQLTVLAGPRSGTTYRIVSDAIIGRGRNVTIRIDDAEMSRRHACIERVGADAYRITDLGSRNGTTVNGVAVEGPTDLPFGSRVCFGARVEATFTRHTPHDADATLRERMEMLGRLSSGIVHDSANTLSVIRASVDHLGGLSGDVPLQHGDVRACLRDIEDATRRAEALIGQLLNYVRGGDAERTPVDVSALCIEVARLASRTFTSNVRVVTNITPGLHVHGSPVQLYQLFLNLCVNARDAMPNGGTVTVLARHQARHELVEAPMGSCERFVGVTISDTGSGMDDDTKSRIFQAGFTTKERGSGTGLGLATLVDVLDRHAGAVAVESSPGQGSAFHISIPAL